MFISELFENSEMADILTARELINSALNNSQEKHKYFDFLKHLRDKHGAIYSTFVHKKASALSKGNI